MLDIKILSNVVIFPLVEIVKNSLSSANVEANIVIGAYNNLLQESYSTANDQILIVFWEISQLSNYLCYRADLLEDKEVQTIISHAKKEIDLFFKNVSSVPIVIFNRFSCLAYSEFQFKNTSLNTLTNVLNQYLDEMHPANVKLIDIDKLIVELGIQSALDWRFFTLACSPYTHQFYSVYSDRILPIILGQCGLIKKAIIFDCDNTLWGGVVGECGIEGIQLSFTEKQGIPYAAVQVIAAACGVGWGWR